MQKLQGRLCRYCGHNNKNQRANVCSGCGGSLAPLLPPSRLVTAVSHEAPVGKLPMVMVAFACLVVVGIAMIIPLPMVRHASAHSSRHSAIQVRQHAVSYAPASGTLALAGPQLLARVG